MLFSLSVFVFVLFFVFASAPGSINTLAAKVSKVNWTRTQKTDRIIKRQKRRQARERKELGRDVLQPRDRLRQKERIPLVRTAESVRCKREGADWREWRI